MQKDWTLFHFDMLEFLKVFTCLFSFAILSVYQLWPFSKSSKCEIPYKSKTRCKKLTVSLFEIETFIICNKVWNTNCLNELFNSIHFYFAETSLKVNYFFLFNLRMSNQIIILEFLPEILYAMAVGDVEYLHRWDRHNPVPRMLEPWANHQLR